MKQIKYKRKNIIILILIIFIIIVISMLIKSKKNSFKDDLIFFKIFNQAQDGNYQKRETQNQLISEGIYLDNENYNNESENYKQYIMEVSYKNIDLKNINLVETIDNKTLVNEKIAPGTKGEFEILIRSNEKLKYQIKFESQNQKPQNLIFYINGKNQKYSKLEDMEEELNGEIINKEQKIHINWEWIYDDESKNDMQDTQDGMNIEKYNFDIYTIGEE